ncbi:MAG: CatB-related O-acetyltransferase [Selenomonadaceae bacterium]|nr:CatB-related O-acetyltransferase [Selenomonadaceae bacterium]
MAFNMPRSPKDEKLFNNYKEKGDVNIITLGRGGSIRGVDISLDQSNQINILSGRFSSFANNLYCLIGGNHSMKSVSTSPLDVKRVIRHVFGEIRPNLKPLPQIRENHQQIVIGSDVWIGRFVTIMGGVKIGNGAVIGARSVVAKNIPPYAIAVGNPARVVKYRFDEETIRKLLAVKWWNWDLEKIADNFPLMNDVEKFLEAHYSPELEEFPEDEFTKKLAAFGGGASYHFIPDFEAQNPLWLKVIQDFQNAKLKNALLVIWLPKDSTEETSQAVTEAIGDNKNILTFKHEENFSPAALRKGTHFITTREMTSLEALDYLWNTNVKIISALDKGIFQI